jgi:phage gpG-like protein
MPVVIDARMAFAKLQVVKANIKQDVLLNAIGMRLIGWTMRNFQQEGIERKWKPLSANTVAQRRKGSSKPLQNTGHLRASWTTSAGNPKVLGDTVSVTSNVKYAPFHEFGTKPYVIKPKTKKMLAFKTAGGMRFAKKVNHPGLPQRKMAPSEVMARKLALEVVNAAVKKATAKK